MTFLEKNKFEKLLDMSSGYVLNFSNRTFEQFIGETINIEIYGGPGYEIYCSKAEKIRQIWKNESDVCVGKLLENLIIYCKNNKDILSQMNNYVDPNHENLNELWLIVKRLQGNTLTIELPEKKEETLKMLLEDIKNALARNNPMLVLDRLHTFSVKFLRQISKENNLRIVNERGMAYPLQTLIGNLIKYYKQNVILQSEFVSVTMQYSISIFEKFNDIRNNKSFAHDNEVLNIIESEYVVRTMANLLKFIDKIENQKKKKLQLKKIVPLLLTIFHFKFCIFQAPRMAPAKTNLGQKIFATVFLSNNF
ncbi:MAG: abortive infection family protein [Bacteroidales bacterium]|nr:abortive infection family protein [Bacteroidales bacterium]